MGRFDTDQEKLETGFFGFFQQFRIPADFYAGLDAEAFLNPVLDNQVAQLLAPFRIGKKIIIAEHDHVGRNTL